MSSPRLTKHTITLDLWVYQERENDPRASRVGIQRVADGAERPAGVGRLGGGNWVGRCMSSQSGTGDGATDKQRKADELFDGIACVHCPPWRGENTSRKHDKAYSSRTRKAGK